MLRVRRWEGERGGLGSVGGGEEDGDEGEMERYRAYAGEVWERGLMPYRQTVPSQQDSTEVVEESNHWAQLTRHITARVLTHLTQNKEWRITSASSALVDRDEIPGLQVEEVKGEEEGELGVLGIDLVRTWREGAVGRERTEGRLDRSWALGEVVGRWDGDGKGEEEEGWGSFLLGQMEVCFLMVVTVGNWSCLEEWKRILGLVLTCKRAVREREGWFGEFLGGLRGQLERCEDVEGGLFDMSDEGGAFLRGLLKGFKRTLGQVFEEGEGEDMKEEMEALEGFLRREYGWELGDEFVRRGMLQLDDGEMVEMEMEEMEGEDERGEYAPVVVDLDNP